MTKQEENRARKVAVENPNANPATGPKVSVEEFVKPVLKDPAKVQSAVAKAKRAEAAAATTKKKKKAPESPVA